MKPSPGRFDRARHVERPGAGARADIVIAPDVGPEGREGSTRLKSGTAAKLVLNALTTAR